METYGEASFQARYVFPAVSAHVANRFFNIANIELGRKESRLEIMNRTNARAVFKDMPDDVFAMYIEPLIQVYGWRYASKHALVSQGWYEAFDNQPLSTIVDLQWEQRQGNLSSLNFHPDSSKRLVWIVQAHCHGLKTPCSNITNGKRRFSDCLDYIHRTRKLPKTVVLMQSIQGYRILDGNHRLAAALSVKHNYDVRVPYWLGSRPFVSTWKRTW